MLNFIDAIIFGFKNLLHLQTLKYILSVGIVINFSWIVLGYFFWSSIINFTQDIIAFVPFSMIRSNGAWMLSTFLWLQIVLITFALTFAFLGNFIMAKVPKNQYGKFSISIAFISALVWGVVWFFYGGVIYKKLTMLLTYLPFQTVQAIGGEREGSLNREWPPIGYEEPIKKKIFRGLRQCVLSANSFANAIRRCNRVF